MLQFFLDFLAPKKCLCCHAYDTWLCKPCYKSLLMDPKQICHLCKKEQTPYGNLCRNCRGKSPLRSIFVASQHTGQNKELLSKVIHHYKYHFINELSHQLGLILTHNISHSALPVPDIIIPVPLHKRRLRWRGFNQAQLLAEELQRSLISGMKLPIIKDSLIRHRYTQPQVSREKRAQRLNNLSHAFTVMGAQHIRNKHILLVDDIATTGTTLIECAATLKKHGAQSVDAIVLSRG